MLSVWRDDEEIELTIPLFLAQYLSPHHFSGRPPSYGVLGGLVFTVLSTPYLDVSVSKGVRVCFCCMFLLCVSMSFVSYCMCFLVCTLFLILCICT